MNYSHSGIGLTLVYLTPRACRDTQPTNTMPHKTCSVCQRSIYVKNSRTTLRMHMLEKHPEVQLAQEASGESQPTVPGLALVKRPVCAETKVASRLPNFRCLLCDVQFQTDGQEQWIPYLEHFARHHDVTRFPPPVASDSEGSSIDPLEPADSDSDQEPPPPVRAQTKARLHAAVIANLRRVRRGEPSDTAPIEEVVAQAQAEQRPKMRGQDIAKVIFQLQNDSELFSRFASLAMEGGIKL